MDMFQRFYVFAHEGKIKKFHLARIILGSDYSQFVQEVRVIASASFEKGQ